MAMVSLHAQRVTRTYRDVSIAEALRQLASESRDYTIYFLYDELEDFTITTSVKNKSVPDAIRQMIGFYPISMTMGQNHEIYVECTHKTNRHLKGQVVDEHNLPLAYANVTLLNPNDSTMVGGGVTNESGRFVIPNDYGKVIARVTYVGHKTVHRLCSRDNVGIIKLYPSYTPLKETLVTAPKVSIHQEGTSLILSNLSGTIMGNAGTVIDMLRWTPGIVVDASDYIRVIGRNNTIVYVNNRLITDVKELMMLNSQEIRRIEVIRDPDSRYPSTTDAVIKLYTYSSLKNYLGASVTDVVDFKHKVSNATTLNIDGKYNKLSGNVSLGYNRYYTRSSNDQDTRANAGRKNDTTRYAGVGDDYRVFAGINYALTPKSVIGIQYNGGYTDTQMDLQVSRSYKRGNNYPYIMVTDNDMRLKSTSNSFSASYSWQRTDDSQLLLIADYATTRQTNHQRIQDQNTPEPQPIDYSNDYDIVTATAHYDFALGKWSHKTGLEWGHAKNYGQATKDNDTQRCDRDNDWAAAYYTLDRQWEHWRTNIGLRYEFDHTRTIQDVVIRYNKNYHDILPSLTIGYRVNRDFDLTASYRRTLVRPTYNQLRSTYYYNVLPHSSLGYSYLSGTDFMLVDHSTQGANSSTYITYVSADDLATGNPGLRPTATDHLALSAQYRHLTAQVSYRRVINGIQAVHQLYNSGLLCLSPVNISRYHTWTLDLDYALSTKRLNMYLLASGTLPHISVPSLGYYEIEDRPFAILHGNVQYNVLQHLILGGSISYSTPWTSGYTRYNSILGLNLSLVATLCQGRLTLGAYYNDVFNRATSTSSETRFVTVLNRVNVNNDSRSISLMIRWTFNNITNPFKRRSGNDNPLQRTQENVN
jgi:hypothetical protein